MGRDDHTKPRSLALHNQMEVLFFTNDVTPPTIEKLALGSLNREVVIAEGLKSPSSLTVDSMDDLLFWVDANPVLIQSANINGENRLLEPN